MTAITAAELQSPTPNGWPTGGARSSNVPRNLVDGMPEIQLDNATLRFVAATDGRGDGLGGIDLVAAPSADLEARTVPPSIGGLRIALV